MKTNTHKSDSLNTYDITQMEVNVIWRRLRESAKKRGIPFDLTPMDITDIGFPLCCRVLNEPIYFNKGKPRWNSISYDRIDSNLGYTRDNLVVVSFKVNRIKSDYTLDEIQKVLDYYKSTEF
jgi:hypothetical protein